MTGSPLQLALREWRMDMQRPRLWGVLAGVAVILSLVAPFATGDVLSFAERLMYWAVICASSYGVGLFVHLVLVPHHGPRAESWLWRLWRAVLTGLCVLCLVIVVNAMALGYVPSLTEFPQFAGIVIVIALIVSLLIDLLRDSMVQQSGTDTAPQTGQMPPLLDRLPLDKRAPLVALSVEDHYVRIFTLKGEELVLLRLSDAMREVGATPGAQVHRSHWAAFEHVTSVAAASGRATLTMINGTEIPVSRSNMPKIKEAGLLPR